ncbi:patatin-like phospholipase family protein [Thiohalophilus sp.]|uniref:patatin-like phospholipase family protein n=1 Tax=Thiohalophilus sp. TaxID=3028392 RepID=UPI00397588DA
MTLTRREFLAFLAVSLLNTGCGRELKDQKIGLALGGGGARGLAHIPMLEVLDELGIRPHRIAGCSIGAVMGCLYASGLSGGQIREVVERMTVSEDEDWLDTLFSEEIFNWAEFIEPSMGRGGLIESRDLMQYLLDLIGVTDFSQLEIPLMVVATDFWSRKQVVFESGELSSAIRASIAVPGLFEPVEYQGKVLVDGGLVNPVPYDLLFDDCDVVVAIDVLGERTPETDNEPTYFETVFNTFQIMQATVMREKMRNRSPDIYIKPDIQDIRVLEFYKANEIYGQSRSGRDRLQQEITKYRTEGNQ